MTVLTRRQALAMTLAALAAPGLAAGQGLDRRPLPRPAPDPRDILARAALPGRVAWALSDGMEPLSLRQGAVPLAPASTLKSITALYALDRLGPAHRFSTRVIRDGDTLILAGGGDPVLSTDDLARLAAQLAGMKAAPPARFMVWEGALPTLAEIADEQSDHLPYNPAVSGMILNFNRVHLGWSRVGVDYQLSVEARAAANSPRAYSITAMPGDHADLFTYRHDEDREYWTVARSAMGRSGSRWLPVRLPAVYAGDVFQTLCRARGLVLPSPTVAQRAPQGEVLAQHDSPPLSELVRDMLRWSTNITAEVLGLQASGARDLPASAEAMRLWLGGLGQGMRLADHSGLSEDSRISTVAMTRILSGPGRDLNLSPLLRDDPLETGAAVRAKTGTLNFVSNLAGYVRGPSGREAAFAVFCADPARRAGSIGQEMPAGVATWTQAAKGLQADLLTAFAARLA